MPPVRQTSRQPPTATSRTCARCPAASRWPQGVTMASSSAGLPTNERSVSPPRPPLSGRMTNGLTRYSWVRVGGVEVELGRGTPRGAPPPRGHPDPHGASASLPKPEPRSAVRGRGAPRRRADASKPEAFSLLRHQTSDRQLRTRVLSEEVHALDLADLIAADAGVERTGRSRRTSRPVAPTFTRGRPPTTLAGTSLRSVSVTVTWPRSPPWTSPPL